jgi:uncharacterized membrane protein YeaQ/YmgE (transglycosylase-associated protein family)
MDSMARMHINTYIWCAVGAVIGLLMGAMMGSRSKINRLEDVLVGVFGASAGGDMLASMVMGPGRADSFSMGALGLAAAGALGMLGLLAVLRRAVGPLLPSKKRTGPRH